jgi:hypothetical protein
MANFIILANIFLWVGKPQGCAGAAPGKEGGMQVLTGLVPPSQTVGSLLETPG